MSIKIPSFVHKHRKWFYFRKAIFQAILPFILVIITIIDFIHQRENSHAKSYLYYYTLSIIIIYNFIKEFMIFMFSNCADDVIFNKVVDISRTTKDLKLSFNIEHNPNEHHVVIIRKIFRLRYSNNLFFKFIDKMCWMLGIDSPILIPQDIIVKLGNVKDGTLNPETEQAFLHTTINNLYLHNTPELNDFDSTIPSTIPTYTATNFIDGDYDLLEHSKENLLQHRKLTKLDISISNLKMDLFGDINKIVEV